MSRADHSHLAFLAACHAAAPLAAAASPSFAVRVASRNPASDAARALAAREVEVAKADLLDPSTLRSALEGSTEPSS